MDNVTRNLFSLSFSTWCAVLEMFVTLFRIKASESFEKIIKSYLQRRKKEKGEKKSSLQLKEILTTVAIVCYRYERLAVLQNVLAIILL